MNGSIIRVLILAVLVAALVTTSAQAVDVTFQVRMAYQAQLGSFDPDSDFVDLAGTFNDWGADPLTCPCCKGKGWLLVWVGIACGRMGCVAFDTGY